MAVQTVTTNLNADDIGFSFLGVANGSASGFRSTSGNLSHSATTHTSAVNWTGLSYGDGYAVALATTGLTNISVDNGVAAWLSYGSIPSGTAWGQLAYGNGFFVSINSASTSAARMSLINQVQWTITTLPSSNTWNLCAFGNNTFVAIATGTTSAAYSTDNGATWTAATLPSSGTWTDVEYYNGKFVLIGSGTNNIVTSTNGITWTLQTGVLPISSTWAALSWISTGGANGTWMATTSSVANAAYSTDNGVTWTGTTLPSAANWKTLTGGKGGLRGIEMFIALPQSSTSGAFSTNGITWTTFTCLSGAWNRIIWAPTKWKSIDTLIINDGAIVTVNTDQNRAWQTITLNNGKLLINNTSTSTPITFATTRAVITSSLHSITPSTGLGLVEVNGNWIEIGTSNGTAAQQFTTPYTRGDYIPCVEIETASGSGVYKPWVNVTGWSDHQAFRPFLNGLNGVGDGDGGRCFRQLPNPNAVKYVFLTGVSLVANSNIVICDSTTNIYPGNKVIITGVGIDIGLNCIVESVVNSTTFIVANNTASGVAGTKYTGLVGIIIPSMNNQFVNTIEFGNNINGTIPPNGAKIRVANILITDYTSAHNKPTWISTDLPAYFVGTNGGLFTYNKCLFGESYANYSQASIAKFYNVGFCYTPYVTECYALVMDSCGFASPPVLMGLTAPTSLAATGSCTFASATLTIPSSNVPRPGMLITGTGIRPCVVSTVLSATSITMSQLAHTTSATQIYTFYGTWLEVDRRATLSSTPAILSSLTALQYSYVSGAIFKDCIHAYGGHYLIGSNMSTIQGNTCVSTAFSNDVRIENPVVIRLGNQSRQRPFETAFGAVTAGDNINIINPKNYNCNLVTAQGVSNLTVTSPRQRPGILNEGLSFTNLNRSWFNPQTNTPLAQNTKYWYKTRTHYGNDLLDATAFVDGFATCAAFKGVNESDHAPRLFGATPVTQTIMAPGLAFGNGTWVALSATVGIALVSTDNGANWKSVSLPSSTAPYWKVIFAGGSLNKFYAITTFQTGTAAATGVIVASSNDGIRWTQHRIAPLTVWFRAIAFDNGIVTNKIVLLGGTSTATVGTTANYSANGFEWTTGGTGLASASWQAATGNGSGRIVAISGGGTASTTSAFTTNGIAWTTGGALASSLWQDIAFGSTRYVCISASATNGPTAHSTDGVAWTASVAPTLPTGMAWQKITWTGTVFVIISGTIDTSFDTATGANYGVYFATSTDGISWSALKALPENTSWISLANNGNAVMIISTITSRVAYTADISAATPTWTLYQNNIGAAYISFNWDQMQPTMISTPTALANVVTTAGSNIVTCTSTARVQPGTILSNVGFESNASFMTGALGNISGVRVASVTNATTFTTETNAMFSMTAQTPSVFRHAWQLFRSSTEGFTPSGSNLIATSNASARISHFDSDNISINTPYYYRLRKTGKDISVTCSGVAGQSIITTAANFRRVITVNGAYGTSGTNILTLQITPNTLDAWVIGVVPGMTVEGTGIQAGTTVLEVKDYNIIILSQNLTANIVQITNTVFFGLKAGMSIYGCPVGAEATIVSVDSNTQITITGTVAASFTTIGINFYNYWESPEIAAIPQVPITIQNHLLQSTTMATSPWVNAGCTVTAAAISSPVDVIYGAGAITAVGVSVLTTAANATNTQAMTLGVGQPYTFSAYVRAIQPQISNTLGTVTLTLGSATTVVNLTNRWQRVSVTFTPTVPANNAIFTWSAMGTQGYVARAMITIGSTIPVPFPVTTTLPVSQVVQTNPTVIAGWNFEKNGSGVELSYTQAVGSLFFYINLDTISSFTPSFNKVAWSSEQVTIDANVYTASAASNILIDDYQPIKISAPNTAQLLRSDGGSNKITLKDSVYNMNGGAFVPLQINPAYDLYFHNVEINYLRNYITSFYGDLSLATNSSKGIKLQNVRSNVSRFPWASQALEMPFKGVFGAYTGRNSANSNWNLGLSVAQDSLPLSSQAVYNSMFHEMTFGNTGKGCLHLMMVASTNTIKPYILSGNAYFDNVGRLYLQSVGDQAIIEWPHFIKGLTGFDSLMPNIYAVDLSSANEFVVALAALTEYDLNKGTGYSGTWKRLTGSPEIISAETGIDPAIGVKIKLRITARQGVKYSGRATNFVIGETLQNAASNPTATMRLLEVLEETAAGGTLIVDTVTGNWLPTITIISSGGISRSNIVATNNEMFMPQATSYIAGIRIFTNVDLNPAYNYAFSNPTLTITGIQSGSDVVILNAGTETVLNQVDSLVGTSYNYVSAGTGTIDIGIFKTGYVPLYIRNYSLSANASLPVAQVIDRAFV